MENDTDLVWTKTKLELLIEQFESKSCLWKTTCKEYKDRNARQRAICEIAGLLSFSSTDVKKKLRVLRNQYGNEKSKMKKVKSGDGTDDAYVTKWWLFTKLRFLDDCFVADNSSCNYDTVNFIIICLYLFGKIY